jgi:peptidoglycan/xylan/chitin deacetylase (PgdA/CDA1 family)
MLVCITIDVEHDCPPYLTTYRGVRDGLPRVLELLREHDISGTFFSTGDVARRFPESIRSIVRDGHELGCHGDTHTRFSRMESATAALEIERSTAALRTFAPVTSFRAPNLDMPHRYLGMLRQAGYALDSSQGRHKRGSLLVAPHSDQHLTRIPASLPPSVIRLPSAVRNAILGRLRSPVVLFFHPWEFVDVTREPIPYDCRYRTGDRALAALASTIGFFRRRGASFHRMTDEPIVRLAQTR